MLILKCSPQSYILDQIMNYKTDSFSLQPQTMNNCFNLPSYKPLWELKFRVFHKLLTKRSLYIFADTFPLPSWNNNLSDFKKLILNLMLCGYKYCFTELYNVHDNRHSFLWFIITVVKPTFCDINIPAFKKITFVGMQCPHMKWI